MWYTRSVQQGEVMGLEDRQKPRGWSLGFPGDTCGKEPPGQFRRCKRRGFDPPWVSKIPWRRAQPPNSVFLPGESHGQRRLESYSP